MIDLENIRRFARKIDAAVYIREITNPVVLILTLIDQRQQLAAEVLKLQTEVRRMKDEALAEDQLRDVAGKD